MADAAVFQTFEFDRLLDQDPRTFQLCLLGTAIAQGKRQPCIVRLEKTAFDPEEVANLCSPESWRRLEAVVENDSYGTILGWLNPGRPNPDVKLSLICPATDKHIRKYSAQNSFFVRETPTVYQNVVKPYIDSLPVSQIQWVYNILEGTAESENVILREQGFLVTPDLKWDQKTLSSLYLVVLVQDRSIKSLRDLRQTKHLDLLKRIRASVEQAAIDRYAIPRDSLRFFIHYQPTYYHFHIHVAHVDYVGTSGVCVGQAHLLDDVIDNLELMDDYYDKRTLTYALGERHPLYELLDKAGAKSSSSVPEKP